MPSNRQPRNPGISLSSITSEVPLLFSDDLLKEDAESDDQDTGEEQGCQDPQGIEQDEKFERALLYVGFGRFQARLTACVALMCLGFAMLTFNSGYLYPALECDPTMEVTSLEKGLLGSSFYLGMSFGGLVAGSLSDVFGRKYVLFTVQTVTGLVMTVASLQQRFSPLFVLNIIMGVWYTFLQF